MIFRVGDHGDIFFWGRGTAAAHPEVAWLLGEQPEAQKAVAAAAAEAEDLWAPRIASRIG